MFIFNVEIPGMLNLSFFVMFEVFLSQAKFTPGTRLLLTAEAAWQLHLWALTKPQFAVTHIQASNTKIYSKLLPTDFSASCFGMCNTRCLTHGWKAGQWRQHPHAWGCCTDFFSRSHILCVHPSSSPLEVPAWEIWCSWRSISSTAWQQTSRFTSAQVDLSPSGNTGLAGFGLCPSVVLWKNKATEGLTTFRIPREAVHWPLGILTLYCINLAGNMWNEGSKK